jgi:hypothetical protein
MNNHGGNCIMVDPSPHPQHMNALKHLAYVWSGVGRPFELGLVTLFVAKV